MATNVAPLPAFEPAHPGAILREDVLSVLLDKDVPLVRIADHLGVSRQTLYKIMNEERAITADMAVRLGRACGNSPLFWLGLQSQYDAWHAARKKALKKIERLDFAAA
jgi:addiction module HigA family antidote